MSTAIPDNTIAYMSTEWNTHSIRKLRFDFKLSQVAFAHILGMTPRSLSRLETGVTSPTRKHAHTLHTLQRLHNLTGPQAHSRERRRYPTPPALARVVCELSKLDNAGRKVEPVPCPDPLADRSVAP